MLTCAQSITVCGKASTVDDQSERHLQYQCELMHVVIEYCTNTSILASKMPFGLRPWAERSHSECARRRLAF